MITKQNQINSYVSINTDILSRYELKLSFYFNAHAYVMAFVQNMRDTKKSMKRQEKKIKRFLKFMFSSFSIRLNAQK